MKFVKIIEFMDEHRSDDYKTILLDAINAIKQDQKEHEKKIQHQITTKWTTTKIQMDGKKYR